MSAPDPDAAARRAERARRRLQTETVLAFSRVHQQILRRSAELLEGAGIDGITPARANALIVLFNAREPINARELARQLAISEVTVSRFIRKMEEDGWVERAPDPDDGRAMLIQPTASARERFPTLAAVTNAVLDDVFGGLDDPGLQALAATIGAIQERLAEAVSGELAAK